jgi:hypothetical protein
LAPKRLRAWLSSNGSPPIQSRKLVEIKPLFFFYEKPKTKNRL